MASKKDMRRPDLVIPYVEPPKQKDNDFSSTFSSTMPMAAMFTRNKALGWFSLMTALLNWLGESASQRQNATSPAYLTFGMSVLAVGIAYLPLFLPPAPNTKLGTGTGAPPPAPPQ